MAAQKGRGILLKISNNSSPATFTTVSGIRTRSIEVNHETVDITTSDDTNSGGALWRQYLANTGLHSVNISGSGVFQDDSAFNTIEDICLSGALREFQVVFGNGDILQGIFQVTQLQYAGEYNADQTYSINLESADIITMIRA